ncbi:glycosyltransferase family 2 protein [Sinorhizobium americanum]|uniref:Glycosyltransferase involved in cell wall biosynthesis n=1 Tax=Sinorhizobium americanum TaxID=194963 RepID=A0A4R2BUA4_9HYPH|nr:glycosyltransferase family A protein [Sinorhizobium americanum]TCN31291.1 glycosyltransferase involved in cell wall biosynthesis [Sinorhizobium americanum]
MASVDVVVPCYNYGHFLGDCIASILTQKGVDLRVLVIDNASKDDSVAIARNLAAQDRRIEILAHATNKGATFSYNEGIDWGASEYFLILDADDALAPGALARAAAVLDRRPDISFTHGIEARLEANGVVRSQAAKPRGPQVEVTRGVEFIQRLCRIPVNNIGANTVIRRMSAQKQAGYYRASLPYTDDLEMWLRLATLGDVASIKIPQAIRRYHSSRMSVDYKQLRDFTEREAAFESFFANEGRAIPSAELLMAKARRGLGEHAYWSAISHFFRGQGRTGADLLRLSHRWRPNAALLPPLQWILKMDRPLERAAEIVSEMPPLRRWIAAGKEESGGPDISAAR